ncbi:hypothetical protein GOP47_0027267 [Adiantum capillus-veneris]|nr:hypothetical protein GOP47_0027267 [Adiantum capillus-veneris]
MAAYCSSPLAMVPPCAVCKLRRRKCSAGRCVFAPYFPPDDPHKFAIVHKIFGASNVGKHLLGLPEHVRKEAVNSLVYEAEARVLDRVYGSSAHLYNTDNAMVATMMIQVVLMFMIMGRSK